MKKIVLILVLSFFLVLPAVSFGATGWYGGANVGVAMMSDSNLDMTLSGFPPLSAELSYDTGYTVGGAVGYMMEKFRVEGELSYQKNDIDSLSAYGQSESLNGDISAFTFLANGYFDFATGGPLTPYITAGIGYSKVEVDFEGETEDDNLFTYQIGVGVGYAMSDATTLDLRYRYLGAQDFESSDYDPNLGFGKISAEVASHNITVGFRFAF